MKKGIKTVCYDEELGIEAYWLLCYRFYRKRKQMSFL